MTSTNYDAVAKQYYSRTGMTDILNSTTNFIREIIKIHEKLVEIEGKLISLQSKTIPLQWEEFDIIVQSYSDVKKKVEALQKALANPSAYLREALPDDSGQVTSEVVSQVQTAFQKDPLNDLVSQLLTTFERLSQSISAKRQERLSKLITVASGGALGVSIISLVVSFLPFIL